MLAEREESLRNATLENSKLELEAEGFTQRIRDLDESEQRYKDENWSLETQMHELMAAVKDSQERETKLNSALSSLTAEKTGVEREVEELKQSHGRLLEDQAAAQKVHDTEANVLRRNLNSGDVERVTLQSKVEELTSQNQELARAVASMRNRRIDVETPRPRLHDAEDTMPDEDTPESSPPPSPNKQTPRHGHLETETLRSSLGHAHRMIQNLKSNIHREKTEKIELKRMLQDARDELETRRRDTTAPGSGVKRQKVKPDAFKKPLPRSDLLGPSRRGRTEISLDDTDWEDHISEASPTRTVRSRGSHQGRSPRHRPDLSDVYQTATETDDAFETANEPETATESEAFQTGAESLAEDSNDDLTETEDRGTPRQSVPRARKVPSQLFTAKAGDRTSYLSTASTSDDEISEVHTPLPSQRNRIRVSRGGFRRIRPSGEAPMASHETSSPQHSPVGSFQHEDASTMGQSLFAELEELGSPGSDGDFGTPIRATHMLSQPSTPLQNSVTLVRQASQASLPAKPAMIDSFTMTDPWEPEVVSVPIPEQVAAVDKQVDETETFSPTLVDSSTQYTPTKRTTELNGERSNAFPTPPKTIWDEPTLVENKDHVVHELKTSPSYHFEFSSITAEETAPVAPPIPELTLSTIFNQTTEPVAAKLLEPIQEPVTEDVVKPQLMLSPVFSEKTEPVAFKLPPPPEPVTIIREVIREVEPEVPIILPPRLSLSSISAIQTEPVAILDKVQPATTPLSFASIQSTETLPIEPEIPAPVLVTAFSSENSPERPSSAIRNGEPIGKKPSAIFVSEDATSQALGGMDAENQTKDQSLPLNDISGNSTFRESRTNLVQHSDQGAQTILSSKQIDQLLLDRMASRPFTPSEPRSVSGLDSTVNSPGATPKAKTPIVDAAAISTLQSTPKRPGSSASARRGSSSSVHPPLPADHKQLIAAAQNAQTISSTMGPPLAPASAYKTNTHPKTPNESVASVRPRSRRESQASTGRSSLSSFVSELDVRFNIHADELPHGVHPGTDARMIQAITQTMIGEYLWKYTRKAVSGELSSSRHRRYFWVHPYTRTLYWSDQHPSHGGKHESKAKSVAIEAVRVITDDNPYPPGLHRKSLEVLTPGRRIRFTAATSQRHETWHNALSYLLLRTDDEKGQEITADDVDEFNPGIRSASRQTGPRMSVSSYQSIRTNTSKPRAASALSVRPTVTPGRVSPAPSSYHQNSTYRQDQYRQSTSSRISSVFNATIRGSFASRRGRQTPVPVDSIYHDHSADRDSAEDLRQVIERQERESDRLENVRACCDG
jgi:predicted  nucleic acid-binding Zn-ribbon protein